MDGKRERDGGGRRGWNERDCDAREALEKLKKKNIAKKERNAEGEKENTSKRSTSQALN